MAEKGAGGARKSLKSLIKSSPCSQKVQAHDPPTQSSITQNNQTISPNPTQRNDCCVIHGEFNDCDQNGKRICQCKKTGTVVVRTAGSCRRRSTNPKLSRVQETNQGLNEEVQQDETSNGNAACSSPAELETRNTIATQITTPVSGTSQSCRRTKKCLDQHHETCNLPREGFCDHPHHNDCPDRVEDHKSATRGGTKENVSCQTMQEDADSDEEELETGCQQSHHNSCVALFGDPCDNLHHKSCTDAKFHYYDASQSSTDCENNDGDKTASSDHRSTAGPKKAAETLNNTQAILADDLGNASDHKSTQDMGIEQPNTDNARPTSDGSQQIDKDLNAGIQSSHAGGRSSCLCFQPKPGEASGSIIVSATDQTETGGSKLGPANSNDAL